MSRAHHEAAAAAFDALAPAYDEEVGGTVGAARAKAESTKLLRAFHRGARVLDVGCGTGVDACLLASRGVEVIASDVSEGMLDETRRRARSKRVDALVHARRVAASDVGILAEEWGRGSLDGAYSFFGSLNLEADLDGAREGLARLLKPGAPLFVGLVNPRVLWEWTVYPLLLRFDKPLRKIRPQTSMRVSRARDARVPVWLYKPDVFAQRFALEFELRAIQGCNIVVPPPYLDHYARRLPRLVATAARIEDRIQRRAPWREWGYFSLLTFARRSP